MEKLYEITGMMQELLERAYDPEVDQQMIKDTMESLEYDFEEKCDGCIKVMKELEADADKLDQEIKRLQARKKALENNAKGIKKYVEQQMIATDKRKFRTELFSYSIAKNPASLKIKDDVNINAVPAEYLKFVAPEIDKTKVKEAIKAGETFDWAEMVQTEGIRIR